MFQFIFEFFFICLQFVLQFFFTFYLTSVYFFLISYNIFIGVNSGLVVNTVAVWNEKTETFVLNSPSLGLFLLQIALHLIFFLIIFFNYFFKIIFFKLFFLNYIF